MELMILMFFYIISFSLLPSEHILHHYVPTTINIKNIITDYDWRLNLYSKTYSKENILKSLSSTISICSLSYFYFYIRSLYELENSKSISSYSLMSGNMSKCLCFSVFSC
jgi:hypothetical protein